MKRIASLMILVLVSGPMLAQEKDPARALFNTGRDLLDDGRYAEAERAFREVLTKYPKSDQADRTDFYLITTLVKLGRAQEALTKINAFQRSYPNSKWMSDVQEKRISLTNEVPAGFSQLILPPEPPAPPAPPQIQTPFGPFGGNRGDTELSLQQEILRALLQNNPDRGIDVATERLKADPSDPVVLSNLSAIARSNSDKAFPMIVNIAKTSTSPKARRDATFWVGRGPGDKDVIVTTLLEILASTTDADTERAVAGALAEVGTPRAQTALSDIAKDRNRSRAVRQAAVGSIARNDNPNQLAMLDDLYKSSSDSVEVRRSILSSLSRIGDPRVIPILANVARTDADLSVRRSAVQALGRRKEPEAIKALEDLLRDAPAIPRVQLDQFYFDHLDFDFDFDFHIDESELQEMEEKALEAQRKAEETYLKLFRE